MTLKIGIDFDNTLIDYSKLFYDLALARGWIEPNHPSSKEGVKSRLISQDGNDLRWQELQSIAYGREIIKAPAFEGAISFLQDALTRGHKLVVVSHKTERSNFDPNVELRKWALEWIKKVELPIPIDQIFFEPTKADKVARIAELGCDIFIDDLVEVFEETHFPKSCTSILFSPSSESVHSPKPSRAMYSGQTWNEVANYVRVLPVFQHNLNLAPSSLELIKRTGNSRIYKATGDGMPVCVLKTYFDSTQDNRDRGQTEFQALSFLWQNEIRCVPKPIGFDEKSNSALYSFIDGVALDAKSVKTIHLNQLADFFLRLFRLANSTSPAQWSIDASEARFRLQDYRTAIDRRLDQIEKGLQTQSWAKQARDFVSNELYPLRDKLYAAFHERIASHDLNLTEEIELSDRILSPSDTGLHNMIVDQNTDRATFIDFEYFGWDDPAKLMADFFHSAAMNLSVEQKHIVLHRFSEGLPQQCASRFLVRWEAIVDLIGFEWVLIVLNILSPDVMARKKFADPSINENNLVALRIAKAVEMITAIQKNLGA